MDNSSDDADGGKEDYFISNRINLIDKMIKV